MRMADPQSYLADITALLRAHWPQNRTVNIVCHGHSVPAGYFATPLVDTFNAYPHLLHVALKHRFPFAVINVIVTAIGGENSESGAKRFERDVLNIRPDVITIDYGLNDRGIGLARAKTAWTAMIQAGKAAGAKMLLLTPTLDTVPADLPAHAEQIRQLAAEHEIGLADSYRACREYCATGNLTDIQSWRNHPNRTGHDLVTRELLRWFPAA